MNTVWGDIMTKTNRIRASFILGAAILTGAGCLWNASLETAPEKNEEKQLEAVKLICRDNMNVTQAEELVRTMNIPKPKPINDLRITTAKDVKVFKNTVKRAVDLMKKSGIDARIEENSFEWGTEYIIKIKKTDKK